MAVLLRAEILGNERILPDFYKLTLYLPKLAENAKPGQFLMVRVSETLDPFLKRPLSLHRIIREEGKVELVYQIVGKGTNLLTQKRVGETLEVLGPLGSGFNWSENHRAVALIGGGCGIAPLLALADELVKDSREVHVLLGAQTKDKLLGVEDFIALGCKVQAATDDGSSGHKGFVTQLLEELCLRVALDQVYCCGPLLMTRILVRMTKDALIPCQVSLEERMGCGIGACLGCVIKVRDEDGIIKNKKVCQDGPVFISNEVIFDV